MSQAPQSLTLTGAAFLEDLSHWVEKRDRRRIAWRILAAPPYPTQVEKEAAVCCVAIVTPNPCPKVRQGEGGRLVPRPWEGSLSNLRVNI